MKRITLHKICIVLALAALLPLELALVSGNTLAYLTASVSVTNTFTFEESVPLGAPRRDTVKYYFKNKNGTYTRVPDSGYSNVRWDNVYRANERIYIDSSNTHIATPPNGFKISYATVNGDTQNPIPAGGSFLQPDNNNTVINIYFEPIEYTIAYDFNGYEEEDITFSDPLQTTYTVYDMIRVPYDAMTVSSYTSGLDRIYHCTTWLAFLGGGDAIGTILCDEDVPSADIEGNTLLGWEDQDGVLHRYDNAGTNTSWSTDLDTPGRNIYNAFAARQTGDLVLKANWENEVIPNNANMNNMMRSIEAPELVPNTNTENTDTVENTENTENAENIESTKEEIVTGGTEGKQDGETTTE